MILAENITYRYGNAPALENLSFKATEPEITALWGRNGAGKTTLMKLLAGHEKPNKGIINIKGIAPYNHAEAVQHVCYMQESHPFSSIWTIKDALRFGSYYYPNWDGILSQQLLKDFRLNERKRISKLSKGMKSALQFIIGISSHATITIFDEPSNGLDANMRKKMYQVLRESHSDHPRYILLSTHHIEDIQPLCESLVVIHDKKVLLHEMMDDIKQQGVWLAGEKSQIEKITNEQNILEKIEMGTMTKVMMDVPYHEKWKEIAFQHGVSIEKAKLQDYLLNITEEGE